MRFVVPRASIGMSLADAPLMALLRCVLLPAVFTAATLTFSAAQEEEASRVDTDGTAAGTSPADASLENTPPAATAPEDVPSDDAQAPPSDAPLPEEYSCKFCHGASGTLSSLDEMKHLIVTEDHLAHDIHWRKGLRCHDCHGGNPKLEEFVDHRKDPDFRAISPAKEIPGFCGHCHSDIQYMRRFDPAPRTDQVAEYWTSGHGQRLKEADDEKVATCVSCHGHHDIRAVNDLQSRVYPTRVAETCATCHSDEQLMAGRTYHGRPLGHNQSELWSKSVHAQALLVDGDLSAPTCNDCHGNHGALPPDVDSVANACGTCHVKVAELFATTQMKHRFEQIDLPGCVTCHGNHEIRSPTDQMLGMVNGGVCGRCHEHGEHGATLAGGTVAQNMYEGLQNLNQRIDAVDEKLDEAERRGMEIRAARFRLREARDALVNARSLVHSFKIEPVSEALDAGVEVAAEVDKEAEGALQEYTNRRVWLALSLLPILGVVGLLLLFIRQYPGANGPQVKDANV